MVTHEFVHWGPLPAHNPPLPSSEKMLDRARGVDTVCSTLAKVATVTGTDRIPDDPPQVGLTFGLSGAAAEQWWPPVLMTCRTARSS
jgi:hypothetical protein